MPRRANLFARQIQFVSQLPIDHNLTILGERIGAIGATSSSQNSSRHPSVPLRCYGGWRWHHRTATTYLAKRSRERRVRRLPEPVGRRDFFGQRLRKNPLEIINSSMPAKTIERHVAKTSPHAVANHQSPTKTAVAAAQRRAQRPGSFASSNTSFECDGPIRHLTRFVSQTIRIPVRRRTSAGLQFIFTNVASSKRSRVVNFSDNRSLW